MVAVPTESTERTPSAGRPKRGRVEPYLFVVLEGGRVRGGGARIALFDVAELAVGRGEVRRIERAGDRVVLNVPDVRMSGTHARVVRRETAYHLEDAGSTNGSIVNGEPSGSHALRDGDVVELGQTLFLYKEVDEEAQGVARDLDPDPATSLPGFTTLDPVLARQFERLARVAASPLSLLLMGETGTGKEVLSRAVHQLSKRPGPFAAINCGAIPQTLVESHLFGHTRGAFSGAVKDEIGVVRSAQYGTLLLDEIGDLPAASQAALLRVLQEREVLPVGSTQPVPVDVRIIAATHMPLEELVEKGTFRRDLYARLAGYTFALAPLRERRVDLGLLTASLFAGGKLGDRDVRIHREALRAMLAYDWPMNVRELEQCLRASIVLADDGMVTVEDLPAAVARALSAEPIDDDDGTPERDAELRRELLVRFAEAQGNVSEVARVMGKARQQIQRWVRRFKINPESFRR